MVSAQAVKWLHRFYGVKAPNLSLRGGQRPTWRPEREARGSALGVQSREGTCSSYRLTIKTYKPIASVAALTECLAHLQVLRYKFIGARPPSLSFRGAKRRGNLLQSVTFSPRPTCYSTWYCEIATSAAPPRNDKSGSFRIPFQISVYYVPYAAY